MQGDITLRGTDAGVCCWTTFAIALPNVRKMTLWKWRTRMVCKELRFRRDWESNIQPSVPLGPPSPTNAVAQAFQTLKPCTKSKTEQQSCILLPIFESTKRGWGAGEGRETEWGTGRLCDLPKVTHQASVRAAN